MKNIIYYDSFDSDVVESADQNYILPSDYQWIRHDAGSLILEKVLYAIAFVFALFYGKIVWNVRIIGREKLKKAAETGYFIYGNHTQPFGDVFLPAWTNRYRRIYTVASPANYGIPIIGKILPYLGALPIPSDRRQMGKFQEAIKERIGQKYPVVIYPEKHVWPYYTKIRPFSTASFHYPVEYRTPVFAMTTTYQKRKYRKRPRMTVYIDGPFYPENLMLSHDRTSAEQKQREDCTQEKTLGQDTKQKTQKHCAGQITRGQRTGETSQEQCAGQITQGQRAGQITQGQCAGQITQGQRAGETGQEQRPGEVPQRLCIGQDKRETLQLSKKEKTGRKQQMISLRDQVLQAMEERSRMNDIEFCRYVKRK